MAVPHRATTCGPNKIEDGRRRNTLQRQPMGILVGFQGPSLFALAPRYNVYGNLWTPWDWLRHTAQRRVNTQRMFGAELGRTIIGLQTGQTTTILPPRESRRPQLPLSRVSVRFQMERREVMLRGTDIDDIYMKNLFAFGLNIAVPGYQSDSEYDAIEMDFVRIQVLRRRGEDIYPWDSLPESESESEEIEFYSDDDSSDDDDIESDLSDGDNQNEEEPNGGQQEKKESDGNIKSSSEDVQGESDELDDLVVCSDPRVEAVRVVQTPHWMMAEYEEKKRADEDEDED